MTTIHEIVSKSCPISHPAPIAEFEKILKNYLSYTRLKLPGDIGLYQSVWNIPTFLGMEVEVENVHTAPSVPEFWMVKGDGSLRNGGVEFCNLPLPPKDMMLATCLLWAIMHRCIGGRKPAFTWRTSIQFHLNVQDLKEEEFRRLLILTFLFERVLFAVAGKGREDSIFCTPLSECSVRVRLSKYLRGKHGLKVTAHDWPKYTALNLWRIFSPTPEHPALGTVEFRHFEGTDDLDRVLLWQALILRLFHASVAMTTEEILESLDALHYDSASCKHFAEKVFTKELLGLAKIKDIHSLMSEMATQTKSLFVVMPKLQVFTPESAMARVAEKRFLDRTKDVKKASPKTKKMLFDPLALEQISAIDVEMDTTL